MRSSIYPMGKEAGLREGQARGLREAIEALCQVLSIRLAPRRRQHLASLEVEGLEALLERVKTERGWPR